ncbi:beta-1,3-glucosyltransferase isoform X1 [Drosophila miranda]|uniref:beta-1,3-glucosyltransferase isoform X1 n=1 Tax=Drosophila miranda TaxID=7229 RepID=UPI0007E754EC|nr:beta-1,3-glucosyltransferase isoform X1 [Drosophila miranda]XP_017154259.1 beta-1,3-glucosyltransferase isoform X1 [Drosophila miranda]
MPSWYRVVVWLWCLLSCCHSRTEAGTGAGAGAGEVLVVIACPPLPRRLQEGCFALFDSLREQYQHLAGVIPGDYVLRFHIMHELFNYWTLLDALPGQTRLLNARTEWIIWCQHNTHVASLRGLLEQLHSQDPMEAAYYGHALYDTEATIVHHFAHYKNPRWFPYPLLSAGVVFTGVLLRRLAELVALSAQNATRHSEFAIDASHELARFIFDNLTPDTDRGLKEDHIGGPEGETLERKIILKSAAYICPTALLHSSPETGTSKPVPCLLYAKPEMFAVLPSTLETRLQGQVHTTGSHIYFAIKTCAKFHKERIPIIERTWATDARHRRYYSDVAEVGIPTISTGIPNVQTGHCAKTLAILQLSLKDIIEQRDIRWLMLVDDDTLLSVPRLSALLNGYNHTEHIYLGERYGYRLYAPDGFNYHTGGAGIVLSLPLVRLVLEHCNCPSANAPDDMILGYCLQALGVVALPAAGLHQARPQDYARELLHLQPPISFHKFWNTEPEHTYRRWLGGSGGNQSVPQATDTDRVTVAGAVAPLPPLGGRLQLPGLTAGLGTAEKHLDL